MMMSPLSVVNAVAQHHRQNQPTSARRSNNGERLWHPWQVPWRATTATRQHGTGGGSDASKILISARAFPAGAAGYACGNSVRGRRARGRRDGACGCFVRLDTLLFSLKAHPVAFALQFSRVGYGSPAFRALTVSPALARH